MSAARNGDPATVAELQRQLDEARADLLETEGKAAMLEASGDLNLVNDLALAGARVKILNGTIKRLEAAIPPQARIEAIQEIERLRGVVKREAAMAETESAKIAARACEILVPKAGSHPAWTDGFCQRRRHEIGLFAMDVPAARRHLDASRDARQEIARLEGQLSG